MAFESRLKQAQAALTTHTAQLIADPLDIFYLTGFVCLTPEEREAFLLLTKNSATLFLSSFSAQVSISNLTTLTGNIDRMLAEKLPTLLAQAEIQNLEIDGNATRLNEYEFIKRQLKASIELTPLKQSPLQNQRMIKDEDEIAAITKANHLTHLALSHTFSQIKVGMTEIDVQHIFEDFLRKEGVKQLAFPTIVCFGAHSALPHHQPSDTKLKENDAILIDCGAKWQGYCADVTRTQWFGNTPDPEFLKIENIVMTAYQKVAQELKNRSTPSPLTAAILDKAARDYITAQGFGPQFIHTTGHGVGLYIHEQPSLNFRNDAPLNPNMIVTIEPGIYLDGKFGFRFENSVLITEKTFQELL